MVIALGSGDKASFVDVRAVSWWKNTAVDINRIIDIIDACIPRAHYSEPTSLCWKGKSDDKEENDAHISVGTNGEIEEFEFRVDLRDPGKFPLVLEKLLCICLNNDCLVIDAEGNLMEPNMKIVGNKLLKSNAIRFLIDPEDFLKNL